MLDRPDPYFSEGVGVARLRCTFHSLNLSSYTLSILIACSTSDLLSTATAHNIDWFQVQL